MISVYRYHEFRYIKISKFWNSSQSAFWSVVSWVSFTLAFREFVRMSGGLFVSVRRHLQIFSLYFACYYIQCEHPDCGIITVVLCQGIVTSKPCPNDSVTNGNLPPEQSVTFVTGPGESVIIGAGRNHRTIFCTVPKINAQKVQTIVLHLGPD